MPIELRFSCVLPAPPDVVWERAVALSGANDELWPFAKMTFPIPLGRDTPPEQVVGQHFTTRMLVFGVVPLDRRTMQIEVFEEGRFRECSTSLMQGHMCHERTAVAADDGSTAPTDTLTYEPRGRLVDAVLRMGVTMTFHRRHRRLRHHFDKTTAKPASAESSG